jgi:tetratricopeptide (TPR) repeat protein
MKRALAVALTAVLLSGCKTIEHYQHPEKTYAKRMFYEKYLNPGDPFDSRVIAALNAVRAHPTSAAAHNELGQLLRAKGFPKDAEMEFEYAVDADSHYYPAWYNLGLVREAQGNTAGARFAYGRTIHYKPGHAMALFQMGLLEEGRRDFASAVDYYAKAILIDHNVLDVRVNPRVVDSNIMHLAILRAYPNDHAKESARFQGAPEAVYTAPEPGPAVSPQPAPQQIVTPAAPVTSPGAQQPPPTPRPPGQ